MRFPETQTSLIQILDVAADILPYLFIGQLGSLLLVARLPLVRFQRDTDTDLPGTCQIQVQRAHRNMAAPDRPAAQCIVNGSFRRLDICWLSADCSILASECIGTVGSPERCCLHRSFVCPCRNRHQPGAFDVGNLLGKLRRFQIRAGSKVMNTHCVRQCYFRLLSICLNVLPSFSPKVTRVFQALSVKPVFPPVHTSS